MNSLYLILIITLWCKAEGRWWEAEEEESILDTLVSRRGYECESPLFLIAVKKSVLGCIMQSIALKKKGKFSFTSAVA